MKFFSKIDHIEGTAYPWGSFIMVGKTITTKGARNGWYIRIELPFTKNKDYIDTNDYMRKNGPCRKLIMWLHSARIRKPHILRICLWANLPS